MSKKESYELVVTKEDKDKLANKISDTLKGITDRGVKVKVSDKIKALVYGLPTNQINDIILYQDVDQAVVDQILSIVKAVIATKAKVKGKDDLTIKDGLDIASEYIDPLTKTISAWGKTMANYKEAQSYRRMKRTEKKLHATGQMNRTIIDGQRKGEKIVSKREYIYTNEKTDHHRAPGVPTQYQQFIKDKDRYSIVGIGVGDGIKPTDMVSATYRMHNV